MNNSNPNWTKFSTIWTISIRYVLNFFAVWLEKILAQLLNNSSSNWKSLVRLELFQNGLQPILVRLEQFQYDLINKKKQEKKRGHYTNSGQIVVKSVNIEQVIKKKLSVITKPRRSFHLCLVMVFPFASVEVACVFLLLLQCFGSRIIDS